jgi:hypothetical protein
MDFLHAAKQLAREIVLLETQVQEKKAAFNKLWGTLTPQEQLLMDSPSTARLTAPAEAETPAPAEAKTKKTK